MSSTFLEEYLKKSPVKLFKYLDNLNAVREKLESKGYVVTEHLGDVMEISHHFLSQQEVSNPQSSQLQSTEDTSAVHSGLELELETLKEEDPLSFHNEINLTLPMKKHLFGHIAQRSIIDAADFEMRVDKTFLEVYEQLPSNDAHYFTESAKIIKLSLPLTQKTFEKTTKEEWFDILMGFSRVSLVSDISDIKRSCQWLNHFENGKKCENSSIFIWLTEEEKQFNELWYVLLGQRKENEVWAAQYLYMNMNVFCNSLVSKQLQVRVPFLKYLILKDDKVELPQLDSISKVLECSKLNCLVGYFPKLQFTTNFKYVGFGMEKFSKEFYLYGSALSCSFKKDKFNRTKYFWDFLEDSKHGYLSPHYYELPYVFVVLQSNQTRTSLACGGDCSIGSTGAKYISEALGMNRTLTALDISYNQIYCEGARYLSEALRVNQTLTTLNIRGNEINLDGAKYLSEVLQMNQTLTTLDIGLNLFGAKGARCMSQALRVNQTLRTLNIRANNINFEGVRYLSEALLVNQTLTTLDIGANRIGTGAKALSEALRMNHTLTTLGIQKTEINSEELKYLCEALQVNQTLTTLDISLIEITCEGVNYLCEVLRVNRTLTTLDIGSNQIGPEGAKYLSKALQVNQTLTTLNMPFNKIGSEGAKYLSEALRVNQTLKTLDIGENEIDSEGMKYLCEAFQMNQSLTTWNIGVNQFDSNGVKYLAETLRVNQTLTTLTIRDNKITPEGAKYLAEGLRVNQTLTTLDMEFNCSSCEGVKYIAEALRVNQTLTTLNMKANQIGPDGAKYLSEALLVNQTLTTLDIGFNDVSSKLTEISRFLKRNNLRNSSNEVDSTAVSSSPEEDNFVRVFPSKAISLFSSYLKHRWSLRFHDVGYQPKSYGRNTLQPSFCLDDSEHRNLRSELDYFLTDYYAYICCICSSVCHNPYGTNTCCHIFCKNCIQEWMKRAPRCPLCNRTNDCWTAVPATDHLIAQLAVYCPCECGWKGTLSEYESLHESKCPRRFGMCSFCEEPMSLSQFEQVHKMSDCFAASSPCSYCGQIVLECLKEFHKHCDCCHVSLRCHACEKLVPRKDFTLHVNQCEFISVPCRFASIGCESVIERRFQELHELDYMNEHLYLLSACTNKLWSTVNNDI